LNQPWVDALHGDLGIVNSGDGALLLSNGGDIDELLVIIPHLKRTGPPASQ
jgi:arabinose-5-phosphate isomerase